MGIQGLSENGVVLADGRVLDADIVVLATGYDNIQTSVTKVLGEKVAERCKDVWDLDEEGKVNTVSECTSRLGRLLIVRGDVA